MRSDKNKKNFLDVVPEIHSSCTYHLNDDNAVVIDMTHKGVYNKIAQKIFKKPKVSHITLDNFGSFVYTCIDGNRNVYEIGQLVEKEFGEKCQPLYERLSQFMRILKNNNFISFKKQVN